MKQTSPHCGFKVDRSPRLYGKERDTIPKPSAEVGAGRSGTCERCSHEVEQGSSRFELRPILIRNGYESSELPL